MAHLAMVRGSGERDNHRPARRATLYSARMGEQTPFERLVDLCARLRSPTGCPWDREQTLDSLRTYVIEEAYEVVEGMSGADPRALAGELGDLLFQIVFVAQIASEKGWFDVHEVCRQVHAKMVRRHPHVFGDRQVEGAAEVVRNWEAIKQGENGQRGALEGVPRHLPALLKALRITEKAAALGFDWQRVDDVAKKLREEVDELAEVLAKDRSGQQRERARAELGDVLFAVANLARHLNVDPEIALQEANARFVTRFAHMERAARQSGVDLRQMTLDEMDALWEAAKAAEKGGESEIQ